MFSSESQLLDAVLGSSYVQSLLKEQDGQAGQYHLELAGLFGVPDLVVVGILDGGTGAEIAVSRAFELKLSNWRRALVQAYRYRAFANLSYVVLDGRHSRSALAHLDLFRRSNIGLLSVSERGSVVPHYEPEYDVPYCDHLTSQFEERVLSRALRSSASSALRHEAARHSA
jgi:hypothetical protein